MISLSLVKDSWGRSDSDYAESYWTLKQLVSLLPCPVASVVYSVLCHSWRFLMQFFIREFVLLAYYVKLIFLCFLLRQTNLSNFTLKPCRQLSPLLFLPYGEVTRLSTKDTNVISRYLWWNVDWIPRREGLHARGQRTLNRLVGKNRVKTVSAQQFLEYILRPR